VGGLRQHCSAGGSGNVNPVLQQDVYILNV